MAYPVAALLGFLFSSSLAQREDVRTAKAYLREVKKHLLESYVDRNRLSEEQLTKAGLRGLADASVEKGVAERVRKAESLDQALSAVAEQAEEGFDFLAFADHAARAMVRETGDPYSRILTQEEFNKLLRMMQGGAREESAGISVRAGNGEVAYIQYGYPAYEEGIEIGDLVLEVGGRAVAGLSQESLNELLRLRTGTEIPVKIRRPGHRDPYVFMLRSRKTPVRDVRSEYFGEGIGYLRLTIFDLRLSSEVKKALEGLQKQGMKTLILDLRHNPGGALPAATAVADLFLPQGLVITTTQSNYKPNLFGIRIPGAGGDQEFKTKVRTDFEEMPLLVLVNRASASASELLSGALQDHKRATIVGETTYGKGVGQAPIFLTSVFQKRYLYLTVMTYKLPSGRSIHHQGVVPDIEYRQARPSAEKFAEIWRVRTGGRLEKYLDESWPRHGDRLRQLAKNDGFEWDRYPDFERLYSSLDTTLTKDEAREEVRRTLRRRLERTEDAVWVSDLETDLQLQRAFVQLLDR